MVGFLNALFNLIAIVLGFLEKYKSNKKRQIDIENHKKAEAYEKLQKAIKARMAVRKSIASDNVMSDDGSKRD